MPVAVLIGKFLDSIALILQEKQFLYCLVNTNDLRLFHPVTLACSSKPVHHANGCFDWVISGQHSVNLSREAISMLSGKYKRFTFVHPVTFRLFFKAWAGE